ncbi:hypothetical protein H310_05020 [Aphanomyces invadans]|uniref:Ubiquitin-conjugating enzyme E2C-binding protein n=1 Tax=Aphanomyces invadans TaxID=157072 RepID=A0A024UCJ5_9STRA|nr:hypothetical protein H310_05020 [Aphanomyces invadans]ETW03617.1 hypothetical protein H310_05020 [Aphanomyces invadans]|eukprot:XP_008867846.1 hypothetical protein H310_05020 [Aphanomyces invadans]
MAEAAAALLKEFEEAKREVEAARRHLLESQRAYEREKELYTSALQAKKAYADEVEVLAIKLDTTLADVTMQPEYAIEFQANIGCYQCYVHIDMTNSTTVPFVQLDPSSKKFQLLTSSQHKLLDVALDHAVDATSSIVRVQKDHVHIRIPLTAAAKESRKSSMTVGLTSRSIPHAELEVQNYSQLLCRSCNANLKKEGPLWVKALPLPSSNWMEMADFWGAAEGAFEHIPRDGIEAAAGRIYVASADLLLHASNINLDSVQVAKTSSNDAQISCANCTTAIGTIQNNMNVRLFKHCIDTRDGIFASYSCDAVLVSQMLEVIESDGIFRFDIVDESDRRRLFVQVLSWDATIQTSELSHPHKVLKVLFSVPGADSSTEGNGPELPSRELRASTALLDEVVHRLNKSASFLPSTIAGISKGSIGFLFG